MAEATGDIEKEKNTAAEDTAENINNPPTENNTETVEEAQAEENTETEEEPQAEENTETEEEPQAEENTETEEEPQAEENTETEEEPQAEENTETEEEAQAEENTETIEEPQAEENTETEEEQQTVNAGNASNSQAAVSIKKTSKKRKIIKICVEALFAVILSLLVLNSVLSIFVPHYYPTFGGYRLISIVSDSMEPEIMTGDMIVVKKAVSEDEIKVGTVITFEVKEGNAIHLVTHRVVRIVKNSQGETAYYTRGDNAAGTDGVHPTFSDVVGIYTGQHCGFFGYLFGFLHSQNGAIALIVILLILVLWIIVSHYINFLSIWKKLTVKVLGKSKQLLVNDDSKAITVSDAIGIIISEPKSPKDAARKEKKLRKYIEDGVLPERPWDVDNWEYEELSKKVPSVSPEEWKSLTDKVLEKSRQLLAEDGSKAKTVSDAIRIVTSEPKSPTDAAKKEKKLQKYIEEGVLPERPWDDDDLNYGGAADNGSAAAPAEGETNEVETVSEPESDVVEEEAVEAETVSESEPEVVAEEPAQEEEAETVEEVTAEPEDEPETEVVEECEPEAVEEEPEIAEPEFEEAEQLITAEQILSEAEEEPEDEEPEFEILPEEDEPQEEVRSVDKLTGMAVIVRYKKSFTAKLIQSDDKAKAYYSMLKNVLLSYSKVKSRISWNHENFNYGRSNIARFSIRGKSLCVYLALDPNDYADTKYKVEYAESKKYENIPCMYRIKNARRAKYALDLIAALAEKFGLEKGEEQKVNYYLRYEPTQPLVDRGLIKELVSEEDYNEFMRQYSRKEVDRKRREFISAKDVNEVITDDVAIALVENKREETSNSASTGKTKTTGRKGIINVDTLSENYGKNETVNLESLKEKGLIAKNVGSVKVLARGTLNKPLTVEAQDFSIEAIKMIVLTGGKATKV